MHDGRKRFLMMIALGEGEIDTLTNVYGNALGQDDATVEGAIRSARFKLWCEPYDRPRNVNVDRELSRGLMFTIGHDIKIADRVESAIEPRISLTIDGSLGDVRIHAPMSCAYPLFFRRVAGGLLIGAFPQDLVVRRPPLDERGLCAFLHYGAAVSPYTVLEGIERFTPGPEWRIDLANLEITKRPVGHIAERDRLWRPKSKDDLDRRVCELIDTTLVESCPDRAPLILFSGGVDSGLLAARAASLGWTDTILVHYSFSEDDPETVYARRMANELGLRLEIVRPETEFARSLLDSIGRVFPQPSSDHSVIPTSELVQALPGRFPDRHSILDGTSADAFFGSFSLDRFWRFLFAMPGPVRRLGSVLYERGGYAERDTALEKYLRSLRLTTLAPKPGLTSVMTNALSGVAYHFDAATISAMHQDIEEWVGNIAPVDTVYGFMLLGFCQHAIELCAQKSAHWCVDGSQHMVYPYHWNRISDFFHNLDLSSLYWAPDKATLKRLLERSVSRDLVHRPKGIFVAPMTNLFRDSAVSEVFHDFVLSPTNPLDPYLDRRQLQMFAQQMRDGISFPRQTRHLIWALIFISLWLEQFDLYAAGQDKSR